jgi:hypothetical protein
MMGGIDHGPAERRVGLVDAAIDDEGASELQFGERQFIGPRQGRVALAEFVDRRPHVAELQFLGEHSSEGEIGI